MAEYLIQDSTLSDIANAIRSKTGKGEFMTPLTMPSEIEGISTGYPNGTEWTLGLTLDDLNLSDVDDNYKILSLYFYRGRYFVFYG